MTISGLSGRAWSLGLDLPPKTPSLSQAIMLPRAPPFTIMLQAQRFSGQEIHSHLGTIARSCAITKMSGGHRHPPERAGAHDQAWRGMALLLVLRGKLCTRPSSSITKWHPQSAFRSLDSPGQKLWLKFLNAHYSEKLLRKWFFAALCTRPSAFDVRGSGSFVTRSLVLPL